MAQVLSVEKVVAQVPSVEKFAPSVENFAKNIFLFLDSEAKTWSGLYGLR